MIAAIGLVLACQLLGEIVSRSLVLPVPGPVVGLLVLLLALFVVGTRSKVSEDRPKALPIERVSDVLLGSLGLFFVPATVGVIQTADVLSLYGGGLLLAVAGSTILALVSTVMVFIGLSCLMGHSGEYHV